MNQLVKYVELKIDVTPKGNFYDSKKYSIKLFEEIMINCVIQLKRSNVNRIGREYETWLKLQVKNLKDLKNKFDFKLEYISEIKWNISFENKLWKVSKALRKLIKIITEGPLNEDIKVIEILDIIDMDGFPTIFKPQEHIIEYVQKLEKKTFKQYEQLNRIKFNEKLNKIKNTIVNLNCLDNNEDTDTVDLNHQLRIENISQWFTIYSTITFTGVFVIIGLTIFASSIILTETTRSCDSDKDCYASDLHENTTIGPLDINTCYDYLRNNFSIHCYSCSVNYILPISKSGSVIAFGNFFLGLQVSLLLGSIHVGNKSKKSLKAAAVLFLFVNIFLLIFFLGSVASIFIEAHYKSNGTKTTANQWELYLGYLTNIFFTLSIPLIFTSIIFGRFTSHRCVHYDYIQQSP